MKKSKLTIFIFLLCFNFLFSYDLTTSQVDRLDQDWWAERHYEMKELVKSTPDSQIVFIGDSITHGWGGEPKSYYKPGDKIYEDFFSKYNAINLGISGDKTENVLWRLNNLDLELVNPNYFVLLIGTNNFGHHKDMDAEDVFLGINEIVKHLETNFTEATIILMKIFPRSRKNDIIRTKINITNKLLEEKYSNNTRVKLLDINQELLYKNQRIKQFLMPDFLHLSAKGYTIWAEAIKLIIDN